MTFLGKYFLIRWNMLALWAPIKENPQTKSGPGKRILTESHQESFPSSDYCAFGKGSLNWYVRYILNGHPIFSEISALHQRKDPTWRYITVEYILNETSCAPHSVRIVPGNK
uniref:MATH domain-containing protein n=1 Tax=Trichuris muris TaxID=70415 RepID=A0A5S6QEF3_TRIMR